MTPYARVILPLLLYYLVFAANKGLSLLYYLLFHIKCHDTRLFYLFLNCLQFAVSRFNGNGGIYFIFHLLNDRMQQSN